MLKENAVKFLKTIGFNVEPEALTVLNAEADPVVDPEEEDVTKNVADSDEPESIQDDDLVKLMKEFGGVRGMRTLLSNARQIAEDARDAQETERANLVAEIVLNSGETMEDEDLKETPLPLLRKMAEALRPVGYSAGVDYSALAPRKNVSGESGKIAPRPVHFSRNLKEEDNG